MFGINDNDNKKDEHAETVAPNMPSAAGAVDSGSTVDPLGQAPFPAPLPTIPSPTTAMHPDDGVPQGPGLEAALTPAAPAPLDNEITAEDTMPDYIDEGPKISKRKKDKSKHDDNPASASSMGIGSPNDDQLLKLKQQALQDLAPLVDQLDQSPEERFKTTMMLIQASDNSELVSEAYHAANSITDEKARAQALLDVVNEINYFTQPNHPESEGQG